MNVSLRPICFDDGEPPIPVTGVVFSVGRAKDCDLHLHDRMVSRRHCELVVGDDAVWVRDTQSKNGTFVNFQRVGDVHPLRDGDLLAIGMSMFEVNLPRKNRRHARRTIFRRSARFVRNLYPREKREVTRRGGTDRKLMAANADSDSITPR